MSEEALVTVTFKVPPADASKIEELAAAAGMNRSEYLRTSALRTVTQGDQMSTNKLLHHIIYELVRTRVSLFSIAEKLVDAESLELVYREACPVAQRYVARLPEEMGRAERGEPRR